MEDNIFAQSFGGNNLFGKESNSEEEPMWNALVSKIIDGDVIPVVGPEILTNGEIINKQLLDFISKSFNVQSNPQSFSELVYDDTYLKANIIGGRDSIYTWINRLFAPDVPKQRASDLLQKLIESRLFPFIITTSFTPIVEQVMRDVWGKDLRVLKFNNNPSENDDIANESDLYKPSVYYMFGQVGDTRAHSYVVTDQDMLEFCSSWLTEGSRPKKLIDFLQGKFLLMLGIDYSDWLFRFVWYSIRKERKITDNNSDMIATNKLEESFIHFMMRNKTYMKSSPNEVINQIVNRMNKQYERNPKLRDKIQKRITTKFSYPEENTDIFVSYSRSDSAFVELLYNEFTRRRLNVWYDKYNLTDGGKCMEEIKRAIKTAKYFIPILSQNIEREKDDAHVYRNEWDIACSVGIGRTYIIPIAEKEFDFYNAHLPEKIQAHNAIIYVSETDIPTIVDKIINKIESKQ